MAEFAATQEEDSSTSLPRLHVKATAEQICHLQAAFLADAHPTAETKQSLADLTGLSYRWITAWFSRKRRTSGLGGTPPAAQRSGFSRSGDARSFHERLANQDHPSLAEIRTATTASPGFAPSGWPGPQLVGPGTPGIPLGSPMFSHSYPPALDMHQSLSEYGEDAATPTLSSVFSATSSPFPLTPFSLDDYAPIVPSNLAKMGEGFASGLPGALASDVTRVGLSQSTFIDWGSVLMDDAQSVHAHHSGLARGSAYTSSSALPNLAIPNTWPPHADTTQIAPLSRPLASSYTLTRPTPISYPVRLSEVRRAHRLEYVNYLNAQSPCGAKKKAAPPKTLPDLDPVLSQMPSSSSPAPVRTSTPIKRPASGSSLCSSTRKKPRLSSDDKENWPPSSPSPAIV